MRGRFFLTSFGVLLMMFFFVQGAKADDAAPLEIGLSVRTPNLVESCTLDTTCEESCNTKCTDAYFIQNVQHWNGTWQCDTSQRPACITPATPPASAGTGVLATTGKYCSFRCRLVGSAGVAAPPQSPSATGQAASEQTIENPLGTASISVIAGRIIRALTGIVGALALGMFVYAGLLYMWSGGEAKAVGSAKGIMKNALIGLVLIFFAYSIVSLVLSAFQL